MVTAKIKRRVKRKLGTERPTVWIGKNGMSHEVLVEIDNQLERKEMVKAKFQKTALTEDNAKTIANEIAQQTSSEIVEVRGHTFMLYRKKKKT